MDAMDFSDCALNDKYYGGSEKKIGVVIDGSDYMLKFQKNTAFGKRNNHISEYIGSHIFHMLGLPVQATFLGCYKGEQVVACKDFITDGRQFVPFNDVGESTLENDRERYQYDYEDIMQMLRDNSKLTNVEETISMFWNIYVIDALLGNFDRHGANWGFMKENNIYSLAPVFDNGSCLFPNLNDEDEMKHIIASPEETDKRIYTFPTSQVKLNGKKSSYYEVISSLKYRECNKALFLMYERINMDDIFTLIGETPLISDVQKDFYRHMIFHRYEKIIKKVVTNA
jgi:hypothetical protein